MDVLAMFHAFVVKKEAVEEDVGRWSALGSVDQDCVEGNQPCSQTLGSVVRRMQWR